MLCGLTGDFEKAIERVVKEYAPEAVLVEPSGVGKLSDIIKICFKQEDKGCLHLKKAITVVDVRSFDKYRKNYGEFFEDQIAYADLIMLSHQEEAAEEIRTVGAKLRELESGGQNRGGLLGNPFPHRCSARACETAASSGWRWRRRWR